MSKLLKTLLLFWLTPMNQLYHLDPDHIAQKRAQIKTELYHRSIARTGIHVLVFATVANEVWQMGKLLLVSDSSPALPPSAPQQIPGPQQNQSDFSISGQVPCARCFWRFQTEMPAALESHATAPLPERAQEFPGKCLPRPVGST